MRIARTIAVVACLGAAQGRAEPSLNPTPSVTQPVPVSPEPVPTPTPCDSCGADPAAGPLDTWRLLSIDRKTGVVVLLAKGKPFEAQAEPMDLEVMREGAEVTGTLTPEDDLPRFILANGGASGKASQAPAPH